MSNRIRPRGPDAAVIDRAALAAECPDCRVDIVRRGPNLVIRHDDTCPTLTAMERAGRTRQLLAVPDETVNAEQLAAEMCAYGLPARVVTSAYDGVLPSITPREEAQ